jgi:NAD(P)H-hydrate epimerase
MFLTREQSRALDRRAIEDIGVPGVVLMENAGRGTADLLLRLGARGPVVVCCGKGNNGGDGFVVARWLDNAGLAVRVLLFARPDDLTGDAAVMHRIIARSGPPIEARPGSDVDRGALQRELAAADWIVDALFGSGLQGPVRPPFDRIIEAINASGARILAVDIPSGLDADTGEPVGPTIRANHTATIAAAKKGFARPGAAAWLGDVHVIDMGTPRRVLEAMAQA